MEVTLALSETRRCVIGIDVGTGSARAGVFTLQGERLGIGVTPIAMWRPEHDFAEQSSDDIWRAVCKSVRAAMRQAAVRPADVVGLGFDATCSLVALDKHGAPLTVSPTGRNEQNVIVWMDHRAMDETAAINRTRHKVLQYVGGRISPEMEPPKLLWLKRHLPKTFARAAWFFDLPDWLTFRATGDATRSLCTTVCKWTYLGHEKARPGSDSVGRWDDSFWRRIGLEEFPAEAYRRIGTRVRPMGEAVGGGLTPAAAKELGLAPGTPVGVGIIDAHAGGIGLLGMQRSRRALRDEDMETRLALIAGTSTCHMAASREPVFVDGIWGPYFSAMIPGLWLTEGGQSAAGALVDHVMQSHAQWPNLAREAKATGLPPAALLNARIDALAKEQSLASPALLTTDRHVLPYHHGNRSPRADASLRGINTGLTMNNSRDELALQYLATIQAIAYGTRHIIQEMNAKGFRIAEILATGGGAKNPLYLQEHADATGCDIIVGREPESVLLGSAILGAVAGNAAPSILAAMQSMTQPGQIVKARRGTVARFHDRKYQVFLDLYETLMKSRATMRG